MEDQDITVINVSLSETEYKRRLIIWDIVKKYSYFHTYGAILKLAESKVTDLWNSHYEILEKFKVVVNFDNGNSKVHKLEWQKSSTLEKIIFCDLLLLEIVNSTAGIKFEYKSFEYENIITGFDIYDFVSLAYYLRDVVAVVKKMKVYIDSVISDEMQESNIKKG